MMGAVVVELIFLGMTDLLSDGVRPAGGNGIVALHGSVKLRFDCVNPRGPVIEIEFIKPPPIQRQAQPIPSAVKNNGTAAIKKTNRPTMSQRFKSKMTPPSELFHERDNVMVISPEIKCQGVATRI